MAPSTPDLVVVDSPLGSSIVGVELDGKSTCGSTDSSWPNDDPAVIVGMGKLPLLYSFISLNMSLYPPSQKTV